MAELAGARLEVGGHDRPVEHRLHRKSLGRRWVVLRGEEVDAAVPRLVWADGEGPTLPRLLGVARDLEGGRLGRGDVFALQEVFVVPHDRERVVLVLHAGEHALPVERRPGIPATVAQVPVRDEALELLDVVVDEQLGDDLSVRPHRVALGEVQLAHEELHHQDERLVLNGRIAPGLQPPRLDLALHRAFLLVLLEDPLQLVRREGRQPLERALFFEALLGEQHVLGA